MKLGLEIVVGGEPVAEHEGITYEYRHFFVQNENPEQKNVPGFTARGSDGEPLAIIGSHELSAAGTKEGLLCISGLQVLREGSGLYYGVRTLEGGFEEIGDINDPQLQAEWNITPLLEGAGYGGTDD